RVFHIDGQRPIFAVAHFHIGQDFGQAADGGGFACATRSDQQHTAHCRIDDRQQQGDTHFKLTDHRHERIRRRFGKSKVGGFCGENAPSACLTENAQQRRLLGGLFQIGQEIAHGFNPRSNSRCCLRYSCRAFACSARARSSSVSNRISGTTAGRPSCPSATYTR